MPTIKRKVEMNLPQLIEWAWENPKQVERRTFKSDKRDSFGKNAEIYFTNCGHGFYTHRVTDKDTFTVEVEEEVNEYTVFPKIAELNLCGYDQHEELFMNENKSVKQLLSEEETNNKALYIVNDDYSMTLIWTKEEGLVE